jgi:hypothetical protein
MEYKLAHMCPTHKGPLEDLHIDGIPFKQEGVVIPHGDPDLWLKGNKVTALNTTTIKGYVRKRG